MATRIVNLLTPEVLRELLVYQPETGRFFWKERGLKFFPDDRARKIWNTKFSGKETFTTDDAGGYRMATILHIKVKAHRAAWAIHYGEWPEKFIDHINLNRSDNRISNLRQATNSENMMNAGLRSDNTSGARGVYWCKDKKKWAAGIRLNGKNKFLGRFDRIEDARNAYVKASSKYHGEFGRSV